MLFVFFPIDLIFLNDEKKVMGFSRLKPWIGFKAMEDIKYVLEMKEEQSISSICLKVDKWNLMRIRIIEYNKNKWNINIMTLKGKLIGDAVLLEKKCN